MVTSEPWNYGFVNFTDIYRVLIIITISMTQEMDNIEWNKALITNNMKEIMNGMYCVIKIKVPM